MKFEEWMSAVVAASLSGSVIIMMVVSTAKKFLPGIMNGNEQKVALGVGVITGVALGIVAHMQYAAKFPTGWLGWAAAIGTGLLVGLGSTGGSQLTHDTILNPAIGKPQRPTTEAVTKATTSVLDALDKDKK